MQITCQTHVLPSSVRLRTAIITKPVTVYTAKPVIGEPMRLSRGFVDKNLYGLRFMSANMAPLHDSYNELGR